ncbi:MAG: DnaA N-terminal domain-containing protein, partial [Chloroflexota bacterium]
MQDDPVALWQAALKDLSSQVSRANYDTWLEGTAGLRIEADHLVVGTRSEFVTEWLQKRLRPAIIRSLTDLSGAPLDVTFEPLRSVEEQVAALNELASSATRPST